MARPSMAAVRALAGWKEPCRAATTANVSLSAGTLLTVDGVTVEVGDRVLVKNQSDERQNGIYTASEGEWYRTPDAASSRNIDRNVYVAVQAGTANAGTIWMFDTLDPDIGSDDISIVDANFGGELAIDYATVPEVRSAAAGLKILVAEHIETAAAFVALTDGATVAVDWDAAVNFSLTLGGNRTLANPTNGQPGTWRTFVVTQDGTGTRTLAFGGQYAFEGGTAPTLTATAGAADVLSVLCISASLFYVWFSSDVRAP